MAFHPYIPAAAVAEPGIFFVAIMGICTVMIGLVCIILLCMLMSRACRLLEKKKQKAPAKADAASAAPAAAPAQIPNRTEILAAVTAAVAEELGTDVSAIRVHSFKKLN